MERGPTGHYEDSTGGGEACQAFVPAPLPPAPALAIDNRLQARLDDAHLALGRLDSVAELLPNTGIFLYSYVRKEAVLSSQIEGTQSSLADLMLFELEAAPGVPIDDVQEVSSYVAALERGLARIRAGWPITRRLVGELHEQLMAAGRGANRAPAEFRRYQNWVGGDRPSRAQFIPPPPHRLDEAWSALERFINDEPEPTPPLLKAALAHVQFETLHPFIDGNGRIGRLLIVLVLIAAGVLTQPLLYLSLYFKVHRSAYYAYLQRVREHGDWETWVGFFADAVAATANQAVDTARALRGRLAADRERVQGRLGRQSGSVLQVLDALAARPVRGVPQLQADTHLAPNTIAKALRALEDELGIVAELTGRRRDRIWVYREYLATLSREGIA